MAKKVTKRKETKIEATAIILTLNGKDYNLTILEARRLKQSLDSIFGFNNYPYITSGYATLSPSLTGGSLSATNNIVSTSDSTIVSNSSCSVSTVSSDLNNIKLGVDN